VPDIALVSLGTTPGLRRADDAFVETARAAGVSCELVPVRVHGAALRRQVTVTDLVEALAARRAARQASASVVVYSAVTSALLARPAGPYAVRFDSPAALNRPGAAGAWQRARERRVLAGARALLPWGEVAAAAIPAEAAQVETIPLHVPVDAHPGAGSARDIAALAYAGYPQKRGLDVLVRAWERAAPDGARLVVAGIERERALQWLRGRGVQAPANVEWCGLLERGEWQATLARTRLFVNASRREDHGLSQLEALAAGAALVTVPSDGPYEALPMARRLDPRLVAVAVDADALAAAISAGLATDTDEYAARAAALLEPYRRDSVQRVFRERVLPALGLR
jgi:glycosyltransferase involved in cell wall biosynthesis